MLTKQSVIFRLSKVFQNLLNALFLSICNLLQMALVGCLHQRMGKPLTLGGATYRICAECGAYRLYDLDRMKFYGEYFYRFPAAGEAARSFRIAESLLGGRIKQAA